MRTHDRYYCQNCDKVLSFNETYIDYADKNKMVRCNHCHERVNVQAEDGD